MMKKLRSILMVLLILMLTACSSSEGKTSELSTTPLREPLSEVFFPSADEVAVFSSDYVIIDYSNSSQGYVMVQYLGTNTGKIKFRVSDANGEEYTYDLHDKSGYQVFHLHSGSGEYTFKTYEQASGTEYYNVDTQTLSVEVENDTLSYLYPNQYVNFSSEDIAVDKAKELYTYTDSDLSFITAVFNFTINTLEYDDDKATKAINGELAGYLPDIDETMSTGMGICFDYAALMAAMLRSQQIPTRLVIGYVGEVYHAWISVHTEETGWIENIIEFDGTEWKLMDPTFTDGGADSSFIGDAKNYAEKYIY